MLADDRVASAVARLGAGVVRPVVASVLEQVRGGALPPTEAVEAVVASLPARATTLRPVLNATGVVLHTNLGRAALSQAAVGAMVAAAGTVDVELDLASGRRGRRAPGVLAALLAAVPGAEDALVVNNGAAALVLATTALAPGGEVLVSRGEMVEIGDGFRLHELVASAGVRVREVGTTNRTHLRDYADAVGPSTGAVLKVHPSNFTVDGFTRSVSVAELAGLGVPVIHDVGSGLLQPNPLLPYEPDVSTSLHDGAAVVTASGDKLLGGPQAGLVLGRREVVERMRRHPLARALRPGKTTLAALEATLRGPVAPAVAALSADAGGLRSRCAAMASALAAQGVSSEVVASTGRVGGGSAPGQELSGWAVSLAVDMAKALRAGEPAVLVRVHEGRALLDPRALAPADDEVVVRAVLAAVTRSSSASRSPSSSRSSGSGEG